MNNKERYFCNQYVISHSTDIKNHIQCFKRILKNKHSTKSI